MGRTVLADLRSQLFGGQRQEKAINNNIETRRSLSGNNGMPRLPLRKPGRRQPSLNKPSVRTPYLASGLHVALGLRLRDTERSPPGAELSLVLIVDRSRVGQRPIAAARPACAPRDLAGARRLEIRT
jgi:hypothetical protein